MVDRERLKNGDHQYFAEVIREHNRVVAAVCRSFGADEDEAEDLIQEVWILVYEKRKNFTGKGSFSSWLHRLAYNYCTDVARQGRARRGRSEDFFTRGGVHEIHRHPPNPEEELERKEAYRALWAVLAGLPIKEKEAIVLRLFERREPEEVADEMGIEKASVRSNISRGIKRLRGIMGGPK